MTWLIVGVITPLTTDNIAAIDATITNHARRQEENGKNIIAIRKQKEAVSAAVFVVMLVGAYGVYLKLKEHEEIPCACLGTVFKVPMTWVTLGEDLLMAGMALMSLL